VQSLVPQLPSIVSHFLDLIMRSHAVPRGSSSCPSENPQPSESVTQRTHQLFEEPSSRRVNPKLQLSEAIVPTITIVKLTYQGLCEEIKNILYYIR